MAKVRLTKRYCDAAMFEGKKKSSLDVRWDEGMRGFGLRIYGSGRKAWVICYRTPGGRQRWHVLARYEHLTLEEARTAAKGELGRVAKEKADPVEERKRARKGDTVADLVAAYMKGWAKPRKRTWAEDERLLNKDVLPVWGGRLSKEITRSDVRTLIQGVAQRAPVGAARTFAVVRRMFAWACEEDLLEYSPCVGVRPPAAARERERVLTQDEIKTLWRGIENGSFADPRMGRALRLILVTAQRPGEVTGMSWQEVTGDWWTLPGTRTKNGLAHRVPLTPLALELLGDEGDGFVFPAAHGSKQPMKPQALAGAMNRPRGKEKVPVREQLGLAHFTPHDLRRTAATMMTGMGVPRLVVGRILNHVEPGVTKIYDRHAYDVEKREALEAWVEKLGGI